MRIFIILLTLCFAQIAVAQDNSPDTGLEVAAETESDREAKKSIENADSELEERLNGIFEQVENLTQLTAKVSNGVVTLTGEVDNEGLANQAVKLAEDFEATVLVQDKIERTLEVRGNVGSVFETTRDEASQIIKALPLIAIGVLTVALFWLLGGWLSRRKWFWNKIAPNPFLGELMSQTGRVIVIILGVVIALNIIGAKTLLGTVLGGAGVIGIAVGFAVRDTLENYFASLMLSLRQPFRAGDHVLIDEREGIVIRLTSRATILMSLEGNHLRIPNSTVFKAVILNYTTNPERRFSFILGVDAADDPVAAMKTGLDELLANPHVEDDPEPSAIIKEVGDSNILIEFYGWVDQRKADFFKARSVSIRQVKDVLEENGFSLPEPIYRLKIDDIPSGLTMSKGGSERANDDTDKPKKRKVEDHEVDVSPDRTVHEKVSEERAKDDDDYDLLDDRRPRE